ncbi:hypothetical protein PMAYCL1PPCAC_19534, partial [Pristionchus mayeri]
VSYALTITEMMNFVVRMLSEMETNAVSVERVMEYTNLDPERHGILLCLHQMSGPWIPRSTFT